MPDNRGNTINYINKEEIKQIKKEPKKITLKGLYKALNGGVATVIAFMTTNKLAIYLGGRTEDELIKMIGEKIGELKGFLKYADYELLEGLFAQAKIALLEGTADVVSVVWNLAMANPIFAAVVVTALIALGAYVIGQIPLAIINKAQKSGKIKTDTKKLSI